MRVSKIWPKEGTGDKWWLKPAEPGEYPTSICGYCGIVVPPEEAESETEMLKRTNEPMQALDRAFEAESLEWMLTQHPEIVDAIQAALDDGVTPEDIRWRVIRLTDRAEIAKRCQLVARALAGE